MTETSLAHIEHCLRRYNPRILEPKVDMRHAAVAAILRAGVNGTEALFIKRAQRTGDIWSGHMAFPGGHKDASDVDLAATAIRETHEEIGLDLTLYGRLLGHLDHMDVNPIGSRVQMLIVPYVFALDSEPPPLRLNHEVAAVHWGCVADMFHGRSATRRDMHVRGGVHSFAGYEVGNELVWGLTYRMLRGFFSVIDPLWRSHEE